jgi:hypothetical protein
VVIGLMWIPFIGEIEYPVRTAKDRRSAERHSAALSEKWAELTLGRPAAQRVVLLAKSDRLSFHYKIKGKLRRH